MAYNYNSGAFNEPWKEQRRPVQENLDEMMAYYKDKQEPTAEDLHKNIAYKALGAAEGGRVSSDAGLERGQYKNIGRLEDKINNGGLDAIDRAKQAKFMEEQALRNRSLRQSTMARANASGGSGGALLGQLVGGQGLASEASSNGLQAAAQAQMARDQAIGQQQSMMGNLANQQFSNRMANANNNDAVARFNNANTNQRDMQNEENRSGSVQQGYNNYLRKGGIMQGVGAQQNAMQQGMMDENKQGWSDAAKLAERIAKGVASQGMSEAGGGESLFKKGGGSGAGYNSMQFPGG